MNDIVLRGWLLQARGRVRTLWARLLGDARGAILGHRDVLMGKLDVYCGRLRDQSTAGDRDGWVTAPFPPSREARQPKGGTRSRN